MTCSKDQLELVIPEHLNEIDQQILHPVRGAEEDTVENLRFRDTWSLVNSSDFPATTQSPKIILYSNHLFGKKNHNEKFSKKCNYTIFYLNFTSTITFSSGKLLHL